MARTARRPTNEEVVSVADMLNGGANNPALEDDRSDDVDSLNDPGVVGDDDMAGDDAMGSIMTVLAQIPDEEMDARVMVYRIRDSGQEAFLFEQTARDFSSKSGGVAHILKNYGGGVYRIRVYRKMEVISTKTGLPFVRQQIAAIRKVYLEEPRVTVVEQKEEPTALALSRVVEVISNQQQETREMIGMIAKGMQDAIVAIANRPEPPREPVKSTADLVKEMLLFKELFAPPPTAAQPSMISQMKEMLGLGREIREMVEEDTPPADETSALIKMGGQVLEMIRANQGQAQPLMLSPEQQAALLAQQGVQMMPTAAPVRRAPNPAPKPAAKPAVLPGPPMNVPGPTAQITQLEGGQDMLAIMKYAVAELVRVAEMDSDPYAYAVMLIDKVGDDVIENFIGAPDWFESLSALNPAVAEHKEWFEELRTRLLELIAEAKENEAQEQLQTGSEASTNGGDSLPGPARTGVPAQSDPDPH